MLRQHVANDPSVSRVTELQMRNWELRNAQRPASPRSPAQMVCDCVCISRMAGAGGEELARALADRLQWPLFDRDILTLMAEREPVRARLYEHLDECDLGWLEDMLHLIMVSEFARGQYFRQLTRTALTIARKGNAIFLGRAVDLILPRDTGLRIRVIAPVTQCATRCAAERGLTIEQATHEVELVERNRRRFVEHHFGRRAHDPMRYDLILNMQHLTPRSAVESAVAALDVAGPAAADVAVE
ncbi:MAG: cytidylate kinase-like family protein [Phycisphaerales bacterium]|nr:cytidylate kinase-like family protein [Phycisphaerales bacterium]